MGVKDLLEYLKMLNIVPQKIRIEPGHTLLFDANILLYAFHHYAVTEFIQTFYPDIKTINAEVKYALLNGASNLRAEEIFLNGYENPNWSVFVVDSTVQKPPWIIIREIIISKFIKYMTDFLNAGICPILFWDPATGGLPRTEGKMSKTSDPLVLRNVDITYIYLVLKLIGIPSVIAWTEGEKVACAASRSGMGIVISKDSDCIVLGSQVIATSATPIAASGAILDGALTQQYIMEMYGQCGITPESVGNHLLNAAIYLGCDFCPRLNRNGPATLVKSLKNEIMFYQIATEDPRAKKISDYEDCFRRTMQFYTISAEDIQMAQNLVNRALSLAWKPDNEKLNLLNIDTSNSPFLDIIMRGPLEIRKKTKTTLVEERVNIETY